MAALVLAVAPDLFFSSRIDSTAKRLGYQVRFATDAADFLRKLETELPALVLIDSNARQFPWKELIEAVRKDQRTASIPIVVFGQHSDTESIRSARAAGCDRFVANSQLARELPQLLRAYVQEGPSSRGDAP